MARNTIEFQHDVRNSIVIARPDWQIETEQDCRTWYGQYEDYFRKLFRGPVDTIFVLDNFSVAAGILTVWGKYRAEMVRTFTRHSYRVNASRRVSTVSHTSGALYSAASDEAPDLETATLRIRELRACAQAGSAKAQ